MKESVHLSFHRLQGILHSLESSFRLFGAPLEVHFNINLVILLIDHLFDSTYQFCGMKDEERIKATVVTRVT